MLCDFVVAVLSNFERQSRMRGIREIPKLNEESLEELKNVFHD